MSISADNRAEAQGVRVILPGGGWASTLDSKAVSGHRPWGSGVDELLTRSEGAFRGDPLQPGNRSGWGWQGGARVGLHGGGRRLGLPGARS